MFKINPVIQWRWEGDKVLLNTMLGMNRVAGEVLELCQTCSTIDDVVTKMVEKYPGVLHEKMYNDTNKIIQLFLQREILIPEGETGGFVFTPFFMQYIDSFFNNQLNAPVRVGCEITSACNARCMHCYASFSPDSDELTTEEWKRIIDQLHGLHVFGVSFTGGEPLLRSDVEDIVLYAHEKGMRATLATNGSLLTKERIERLKKAGIDAIMLSLDGATPEVHDRFRGIDGLFEKVISTIEYLVKEGIDIGILTTISRLNIQEIPAIMGLVDKLGAPRLALMRFIMAGRAVENKLLEPSPHEYIELLTRIYEKEKELKTTSLLYPDLPAIFYDKSIGLDHYENLKVKGAIELCGAGITTCAISPTGDVKPCDLSGDVSMGNLREVPLKDIWDNSEVFKKLRTLGKKDQKPCNACILNEICLTGCKALPSQVGDNGDMYAADPTYAQCFAVFQEGSENV